MTDKYKCQTKSIHDLIAANSGGTTCPGCAKAHFEIYDAMLEFIKTLSRIEQENLRTNMQVAENAKKLLQEIGEDSCQSS